MGRKGVSKRKPKKSTTNDNNNRGSSNARPGESLSPVRSLVNAKDDPPNRGSINPSAGSKKKNRKGK